MLLSDPHYSNIVISTFLLLHFFHNTIIVTALIHFTLFYVLLIVLPSIILVINQLDAHSLVL